MSLSSCSQGDGGGADGSNGHAHAHGNNGTDTSGSRNFAADAIERIRTQITATLSDDEELELNSEFHSKDKSQCSTQELETIRRERNRMHAKKTRLRKKKMLTEMEAVRARDLLPFYRLRSINPWRSGCDLECRAVDCFTRYTELSNTSRVCRSSRAWSTTCGS
jgi:hypothetical protein